MRNLSRPASHRWSLVLAGGKGQRTRPFVEQWLGAYKPKQFCSFVGTQSMLQHTWDRADRLTPELQNVIWSDWGQPERILATLHVIGKELAFPRLANKPRKKRQDH